MSSIIIIVLITWGREQYVGHKAWLANYKKSSFTGIIKDTVHYELEHDMPTYIFTNDSSHLSPENEAYMHSIAKVGDSLSKINGNDTIYVFRKNDSDKYVQIYPSY